MFKNSASAVKASSSPAGFLLTANRLHQHAISQKGNEARLSGGRAQQVRKRVLGLPVYIEMRSGARKIARVSEVVANLAALVETFQQVAHKVILVSPEIEQAGAVPRRSIMHQEGVLQAIGDHDRRISGCIRQQPLIGMQRLARRGVHRQE